MSDTIGHIVNLVMVGDDHVETGMQPSKIIRVKSSDASVACDGVGGALGHPLVYLQFEGNESVDCYYCSQRYTKADQSSEQAHASA